MRIPVALALSVASLCAAGAMAQRRDAFQVSRDHPAIEYSTRPASNAVTRLNRRIQEGGTRLTFDATSGYLRSALEALDILPESQVAVFAPNSFQQSLINPKNPRAVFFADSVAVGWVRGGAVLEVAAQDPQQGVIFYALDQQPTAVPQFRRNDNCLACHLSWDTLGVPGLFVLSAFPLPEDKNAYATGFVSDHRSPFDQRWGGWYVTGQPGPVRHMGNVFNAKGDGPRSRDGGPLSDLTSLEGQLDLNGYPSLHSDVVSLMVLEHQAHMTNLLTRVGWEARVASHEGLPVVGGAGAGGRQGNGARVREAVRDLVDYMLFIDEAPLAGRVQGSSSFAEKFSARGPRDAKGRSLRQLDLGRRLMRYPCSYMIYTDTFDTLPVPVKDLVYRRMWEILSGQQRGDRYASLSHADRQAIVEILRDTKMDLPKYWFTSAL